MQLLTFAIAALETKVFEIAGRYLEIIDSAAAINLDLYETAGGKTDDARAALSGLYMEGAFARFEVYSAVAQSVTLLITDGRGGSRRQPGIVRVVDQSIDQTVGGSEFLTSSGVGAVAGQGGICTLLPNASAKKIAVRSIFLQSAVAGSVVLGYGTGGGTSNAVNAALGVALKSKLAGGTASDARIGTANVAAANPSVAEVTGYVAAAAFYLPANDTRQIKFDTPIVLTGANLVLVSANALNRDLSVVWDIRETL